MKQVVIIGSMGFIGSSLGKFLTSIGYEVIPVARREFNDRTQRQIGFQDLVNPNSLIVFCAAKVPVRNLAQFSENTNLIETFVSHFENLNFGYLLNFSSDAIYADTDKPIVENSLTSTESLHGMMHCMREFILNQSFAGRVGHIRPTLVYGANDTHDGYGPNRFMRQAISEGRIEVIGRGEELRDHILIDDVCKIASCMLESKYSGAINAVSGFPITFLKIANIIKEMIPSINLEFIRRKDTHLPHGGLRVFDIGLIHETFPRLSLRAPKDGLKIMFEQMC